MINLITKLRTYVNNTIGRKSKLITTSKITLVDAINDMGTKDALSTIDKTTLVDSINELNARFVKDGTIIGELYTEPGNAIQNSFANSYNKVIVNNITTIVRNDADDQYILLTGNADPLIDDSADDTTKYLYLYDDPTSTGTLKTEYSTTEPVWDDIHKYYVLTGDRTKKWSNVQLDKHVIYKESTETTGISQEMPMRVSTDYIALPNIKMNITYVGGSYYAIGVSNYDLAILEVWKYDGQWNRYDTIKALSSVVNIITKSVTINGNDYIFICTRATDGGNFVRFTIYEVNNKTYRNISGTASQWTAIGPTYSAAIAMSIARYNDQINIIIGYREYESTQSEVTIVETGLFDVTTPNASFTLLQTSYSAGSPSNTDCHDLVAIYNDAGALGIFLAFNVGTVVYMARYIKGGGSYAPGSIITNYSVGNGLVLGDYYSRISLGVHRDINNYTARITFEDASNPGGRTINYIFASDFTYISNTSITSISPSGSGKYNGRADSSDGRYPGASVFVGSLSTMPTSGMDIVSGGSAKAYLSTICDPSGIRLMKTCAISTSYDSGNKFDAMVLNLPSKSSNPGTEYRSPIGRPTFNIWTKNISDGTMNAVATQYEFPRIVNDEDARAMFIKFRPTYNIECIKKPDVCTFGNYNYSASWGGILTGPINIRIKNKWIQYDGSIKVNTTITELTTKNFLYINETNGQLIATIKNDIPIWLPEYQYWGHPATDERYLGIRGAKDTNCFATCIAPNTVRVSYTVDGKTTGIPTTASGLVTYPPNGISLSYSGIYIPIYISYTDNCWNVFIKITMNAMSGSGGLNHIIYDINNMIEYYSSTADTFTNTITSGNVPSGILYYYCYSSMYVQSRTLSVQLSGYTTNF